MPRPIKEHRSRDRDTRRRDNDRQVVVGSDSTEIGPSLHALTGIPAKAWRPQTRRWYAAWRRSPMARLFVSDVEWESLGRCASMVEMFYDPATPASVRVQTWNAIRAFESLLGGTHSDRVKSHMKIRPADEPTGPSVAGVDYRAMLGVTS